MILQCENCGKRFSHQLGICPFCKHPLKPAAETAGAAPGPVSFISAAPAASQQANQQSFVGRSPSASSRVFYPALWVMLGVLILGGGLLLVGLYGLLKYEGDTRLGALVAAGIGAFLLLVLQLKIAVTNTEVRIQHLLFARVYRIADIDQITHLTTITTRYGVEADRVTSVVLKMKDGREITLRPAASQVELLIEAIEEARERR